MNSFDLFGNPTTGTTPLEEEKELGIGFLVPIEEIGESIEEERPETRSFFGIGFFLVLTISLLAIQCFRLQVTQGSLNRALAEGNSLRILTVQPERGLIVDINGKTLAQNTRQLALAINPQQLPIKRAERQVLYQELQNKVGISNETISLIEVNLRKSPEVFAIKTNLDKDESLLYREWFSNTPGVIMQEIPIRQYTSLPSLGHLFGYVGSVDQRDLDQGFTRNQRVGKTGLEKHYNNELLGVPGKQKAEVNAHGEIVRILSSDEESLAKTGKTLKLSLDSNLQTIVANALKHELERRQKKFGDLKELGASAVVLDPTTGAIKAMVSLPDYEAELFAEGISQKDYADLLAHPANPLLNRAIQGQYPPGSVIKPPIAAAGLQSGTIKADTQMVTPEAIYIGNFRFPDWKVHGLTNTRKAIAESNDIFFYAVGGGWEERNFKGMGIDNLNSYLSKFGLGKVLGIDMDGEQAGLLGNPEWKEKTLHEPWYIGDTYHSSIGQGYTLTTPLQIAAAIAAIANGGTLWQPHLGWSTTDLTTNTEILLPHTSLSNNFISAQNLQIVREGMRETVLSGSARPLNTLKVTSAGKTGTAEFGTKGLTHAWYTGFAPYENPEIVFSILIEGGGDSYYSSVPVAEEILRNYFNDPLAPGQKLNSEPDLSNPEFRGEH